MLERFHATLKCMLGKKADVEKSWDLFLPYVLFAYRTTVHSSTGFSPYQLLYGREARGPEAVLREAWTGEEHLPFKTPEYLWDVKKRLELGQLLMTKNDEKAKEKRRKLYDGRADDDPLIEGEEVLIHLPAEPKGIAEQWRGPFRILEKTSPVTYRISAPLRGVPRRNFHRNSLKRFVREVAATVMVADRSLDDSGQLELVPHPTTPQPIPAQADVSSQPGNPDDCWTGTCCDTDLPEPAQADVSSQPGNPDDCWTGTCCDTGLPEGRRHQLVDVLQRFDSVFSDTTDVLTCSIHITTDIPFSLPPYRVPERWREPLKKEIEGLLELGVIRDSDSPYSSPVVCVHKPDGGLRMCTDFR